jgi:hypothetical protein
MDTATYSATNENSLYPLQDAFDDSRLSRFARTTATATTITVDLLTARQVNYICFAAHNFTSAVSITMYGNSENVFTDPPVQFTVYYNQPISQAINDSSIVDSDNYYLVDENANFIVDENGNFIVGLIYGSNYRYWQIVISDATNPDGYLEISKMFMGDYLQMPHMSKNQKIPTASTSMKTENTTGQVYGDKGLVYKYGNITLPFVTDDEKLSIDEAFNEVDKINPFYMLIWENDLTFQPAIYSMLTNDLEWSRVEGQTQRYWSTQIGFKQTF